jgi:hypothetical protein
MVWRTASPPHCPRQVALPQCNQGLDYPRRPRRLGVKLWRVERGDPSPCGPGNPTIGIFLSHCLCGIPRGGESVAGFGVAVMARLGPAELENERARRQCRRDRLVVFRSGVGEEGSDPRALSRDFLAEVHKPAPLLDVIREKCLDCSGYQPSEIARCTAVACSLWPYRMGTNPFRASRELTAEQRRAAGDRLRAGRDRGDGRSPGQAFPPIAG